MNNFSSAVFCSLLLLSCTSQKKIGSHQDRNKDAEIIKQLEYNAISAEFKLDTAYISRLMHDDFMAVYPHKLQDKQQELAGIYNGMVKRMKEGEIMDSLHLDNYIAQFYNNTAVVTFYTVTKGRIKEVPYENRRMRWYDVWVKEKGEWKFVASQGTPVSQVKN